LPAPQPRLSLCRTNDFLKATGGEAPGVQLLEGAKDSQKVVKCGYLYKYRPFSGGFFSPSWALRFFR
jgi:hypothetical protein